LLSCVDEARPQQVALEGIDSLLRAGATVGAAGAGVTPCNAVAVAANASDCNPAVQRALTAGDVVPRLTAFRSSSALWAGVGRGMA
jgi:hypothetical protein